MKKSKVCVIIVNFNNKNLLKDCLDSIKKNTKYIGFKVIVVDNGSNDGSKEILKNEFKWVDLIKNKENLGFPKANNIGTEYALKRYKPDYVYFLNNDTKVIKGWLTEAVEVAEKDNKIGLVASKQVNFQGQPIKSAGWIKSFGVKYYFRNKIREVGWVNGACLLIKKEVIEKIGLLDEEYSPAYYEETDFEKRALNKGYKIFYAPKSIVYHKGGETSKKLNQDIIFYTFYKNRARFFLKHFPIYYFFPRIILDIFKSLKSKKLPLLLKAYKDGRNSLK